MDIQKPGFNSYHFGIILRSLSLLLFFSACTSNGFRAGDESGSDNVTVEPQEVVEEADQQQVTPIPTPSDESVIAPAETVPSGPSTLPAATAQAEENNIPSPVQGTAVSQVPVPVERRIEVEITPVLEEIPTEILDSIRADVINRTGTEQGVITTVHSQSVTWPDGSLGCGEADQSYTQALVSGYWVILEVGGENYDYRISESGNFKLCDRLEPFKNPPDRGGKADR